jgi:hypothetical protein
MQCPFALLSPALLLTALLTLGGARGVAACEVVYPLTAAKIDSRYEYDWRVLRTALEKTVPQYGHCPLRPSAIAMEAPRATLELERPGGRINVLVRATTTALENQFLPIRIPVDKGLLGYRICLVREEDKPLFAKVRNLNDLRSIRYGQGKGWADVAILQASGIPVVEGANYEGLFSMLTAHRFDCFSRSVDEAFREFEEHRASHPQLALESELLLYYPLPRYFFVRRDAEGAQLAQRIEAGMEIMVRDGTLEQLFQRFKAKTIERADLQHRRLIRIDNPGLSAETPLGRSELWYSPPKALSAQPAPPR